MSTYLLINLTKDDCLALALVQDAMRFLLRHYHTLSHWPLQIYSSAIVFSPESSVVKRENLPKIPVWLRNAPPMEDSWTPMIQTLTGHSESVEIVAFSPDGKQIASGSDDGIIKVWDAITGSLQKTLSGRHSNAITAIAFLPDSKLIISGARDSSLMLWDTTTGDPEVITDHFGTCKEYYSHLQPLKEDDCWPHVVAFSADCSQMAAIGYDQGEQVIMLFDTGTWDPRKILTGHSDSVLSLAFSPDSRQLVSSSYDRIVKLWDTTTGDLQKTLVGHTSRAYTVAFSPDGKQIVSGSDNAIIFWDVATGDLQAISASPAARSVAFSPDSKQVAIGCAGGLIHMFDAAGNLEKTLAGHLETVMSLAFSPDGKQIVTGCSDTTIKRWDNTIGAIQKVVGHSDRVSTVVFSPDFKLIASGSDDETIKLWDAATGDLQKTIAGQLNAVRDLAFSPDNRQIASCTYKALKLWDAATGDLQNSSESDDPFITVAFSPDGKQIASGHANGNINLWDTATGDPQKALAGHKSKFDSLTKLDFFDVRVKTVTFSPDGKLIASASADATIKLWDTATGDLQKTLVCHPKSINILDPAAILGEPNWIIALAFSSDSQQIAAVCENKTIKVWSIEKSLKASKYLGRTFGSHIKSSKPWKEIQTPEQVYTIEFAAGNRHLATDIGLIALENTPTEGEEGLPVRSDSDSLQKLSLRDEWLCYGAMPFLRLLPDSQVDSWDARGDHMAVGFSNGLVSGFYIDRRGLQPFWETFQL